MLSAVETRVLDAVRAGDAHVDEVIRRTALAPGAALETLLALELRGVVEQQPGMRFRATGGLTMAKHLVIVESPAKAKTINKYLGRDYQVKASVGHVVDLPKSKLGVDIENDFEAEYAVIQGKNAVLNEIKQAAKDKDTIYLAPDPDREGEAIAWHIAEKLGHPKRKNVRRVLFNEITKKAVQEAIAAPARPRPAPLRRAAGAPRARPPGRATSSRRCSGRRCGAGCRPAACSRSPCASSSSASARSAPSCRRSTGRSRRGSRAGSRRRSRRGSPRSTARRSTRSSRSTPRARVDEILRGLDGAAWTVAKVEKKERRRHPTPPFITSRLQQEASRKLGFQPSRTMRIAQRLYEGVELGDEGAVGLITYMRTDSTRVSAEAIAAVREYIPQRYGAEYLPGEPNVYRSKKDAQDAHEAIRPDLDAVGPGAGRAATSSARSWRSTR